MKHRNNITNLIVILMLGLLISACGFHLRGNIVLPALYEKVHIVDRGNTAISKPLADFLERVGSEIVSRTEDASAVITLLSRGTQQRALAVGGKAIREYELQLNVSFIVQNGAGEQIGEQQNVSLIRNYQNDPNDVLGKGNEESIIIEEMNRDILTQILFRLKALADNIERIK
jgi:LPS-assembly lipoprotein